MLTFWGKKVNISYPPNAINEWSLCTDAYDFYFKDTHAENAPSNKTLALTKSMNIWTFG